MGIQQEKDAYLGELLARDAITQDEYNDIIFRPSVNAFDSNYLSARFIDNINWGWSSWQAAKAQAVPEGFVLTAKEPTKEMISAGFNELIHGESEIAIYKAMIEAQEPTND